MVSIPNNYLINRHIKTLKLVLKKYNEDNI